MQTAVYVRCYDRLRHCLDSTVNCVSPRLYDTFCDDPSNEEFGTKTAIRLGMQINFGVLTKTCKGFDTH
jgi:hypothetical protein